LLYPEVVRIRERVADLGLTQVIIAATHTHGGVDTLGLWGPNFLIDGKDPRTMEHIRSRTEQAIRQAWATRRPARLSWGIGRLLSRFGALINDLRDPIVIDDAIRVMRAEDLDGETIATLVGHLKGERDCWKYTGRKRRLGGSGRERIAAAHPDIAPEPVLGERMAGSHRFVIGLGNDELGYIVPANDFVPPRLKPKLRYGTDRCGDDDHYEEIVSAGSQMAPKLVEALLELLSKGPDRE